MSEQKILFVADTAFIDSAKIKKHNLLSVFPRKREDGAYRASLDSLLQRSKLQSAYYDALLPKLVPIFQPYMPAAKKELSHLLRPVLMVITSLFVDRCIRVLHRISQNQDNQVGVVEVQPITEIQTINSIVPNWHFNQEIIQRIMLAMGNEKVKVFDKDEYPEYPDDHVQPNLLFYPQRPGLLNMVDRFLGRFYMFLERFSNNRAKFQNAGFGPDQFYLAKRGLIGPFGIFKAPLEVKIVNSQKDLKLRENLHKSIKSTLRTQFELLFMQLHPRICENELKKLSDAYIQLFIDWFPTIFLEGLSTNLEAVRKNLDVKNIVGVVGHDVISGLGRLISLVARLEGKIVIGVQHSGHYGYIEDLSYMGQVEYSFYDKFITFGWSHIDKHLPQCETIPLPSPKYSERPFAANYLSNMELNSTSQRDVLFLSDNWNRFPSATTCGHPRVDFIDEVMNSQEKLIAAMKDARLSIDHKNYSMKHVDLYPDHFRQLEIIGGANYRLIRSKHKGLTVNLIKTCRILVWDQIGSGTLEVLTSGVPTMVFWDRVKSREGPWAIELIKELERCGVVHNDADQLTKEIRHYLADPEGWMNDMDRKNAIRAFCQKFALTDQRWYVIWRKKLLQLKCDLVK